MRPTHLGPDGLWRADLKPSGPFMLALAKKLFGSSNDTHKGFTVILFVPKVGAKNSFTQKLEKSIVVFFLYAVLLEVSVDADGGSWAVGS